VKSSDDDRCNVVSKMESILIEVLSIQQHLRVIYTYFKSDETMREREGEAAHSFLGSR
jgi:hypothetical protein